MNLNELIPASLDFSTIAFGREITFRRKNIWRAKNYYEPWYLNMMVTQNILRAKENRNSIRFVTALVLTKCPKQIKKQLIHLTCAHISKLPSKYNAVNHGFLLDGSPVQLAHS